MSWLRNIQGQLSDLANEVLNEANDRLSEVTEDTVNPETELQVARNNCVSAENSLIIESSKVRSLEQANGDLEQKLHDSHVEMDEIVKKYGNMVSQRDVEIKMLKTRLDKMYENNSEYTAGEHNAGIGNFKTKCPTEGGMQPIIPLPENQVEGMVTLSEMNQKLDELRSQKDDEIQVLVESYGNKISEVRDAYEEKILVLQQYPTSSTTSNVDILDAVLLEKEELVEAKRLLEETVRSKSNSNGSEDVISERPVVVDLGSRDELIDERYRQAEAEIEKWREVESMSNKTIENLKAQNSELAEAYNDLNSEFEQFRKQNAVVEIRNVDLNDRIDCLKANLIEYEERYELCKRENLETVAQLEKLSSDFEHLRNGISNVNSRRDDCNASMSNEVDKLRTALDESRSERERLRQDVQRFQVAVSDIDAEMEQLRVSNRRLINENEALSQNISTYDKTMRDIIASSEKDLGDFREQFKCFQEEHRNEQSASKRESDILRNEAESLRRQNSLLLDESKMVQEVNRQLKARSGNEDTRAELLEQKIKLLEQMKDETGTELAAVKEELVNVKSQFENLDTKHESSDGDASSRNQSHLLQSQLREALLANTEKSEECEELRNEVRNLEKEIEIRQNCVDEMIAQTNTLQLQQQNMAQTNSDLRNELLAKERDYLKFEQQLAHDKENTDELTNLVAAFGSVILDSIPPQNAYDEDVDSMLQSVSEITVSANDDEDDITTTKQTIAQGTVEMLQKNLNAIRRYIEQLKQQISLQSADLERLHTEEISKLGDGGQGGNGEQNSCSDEDWRKHLAQTSTENENLKAALVSKHEESMTYYRQLEALIASNAELEVRISGLLCTNSELNSLIETRKEASEKREKELDRLKSHLLLVEETSTREAIEAEQRETDLRARVNELETRDNVTVEGTKELTQDYINQMATLTSRIKSSEIELQEWKQRCEAETLKLERKNEALSSLQNVVRELSVDNERETVSASRVKSEMEAYIEQLVKELSELRVELENQSFARQSADDDVDKMREQFVSKQRIIEELESQIEEYRAAEANKTNTQCSYRVDDATLRQLFLSYFVAEPAKKGDIAMLLASILEYSPDDMETIRQGMRTYSPINSLINGNTSRLSSQNTSLSQQFIRFLEAESESSKTAPNLPVRSSADEQRAISFSSSGPTSPSSANTNSRMAGSSSEQNASNVALDSILQ